MFRLFILKHVSVPLLFLFIRVLQIKTAADRDTKKEFSILNKIESKENSGLFLLDFNIKNDVDFDWFDDYQNHLDLVFVQWLWRLNWNDV